jgi:hypothetical protein
MEQPLEDFAQEQMLRNLRRPLTPAPSEGPVGNSTQSLPSGDPTKNIGQIVAFAEVGKGAPIQAPTPRPFNPSLLLTPATYINPNHYLFPLNLGGRLEYIPLASIPQGNQLAYAVREDWRRPAAITPAATNP